MADKPTDLLMKFTLADDVLASGTSQLDFKDTLLKGFRTGRFFEIDDFDMGFQLNEFSSERAQAGSPQKAAGVASGKFSNWRTPRVDGSPPTITYPVEMDPFSITRNIDKASPILFESCANSKSFKAATLVKRKATGGTKGLQGFLRMDFTNVLITSISWDDGEMVKEKFKFICRSMTMQYRVQGSDGSLGAASNSIWQQEMALRQPPK